MSTETTQQKLESILTAVEDVAIREELFHRFFVLDPLQFAKLLHSLSLPDAVKGQLLALKVGQPPQYKGEGLDILIDRAMSQMWARLAEDCR